MRERLFLLEMAEGGFILARRTKSGQFSPVGRVEKKMPLQFSPEDLGHLRNIAAWVAFNLREQYPGKIGDIDTSDPHTIAEGRPSDSLRFIVGRRKDEDRICALVHLLVSEFGVGITEKDEKNFLFTAVQKVVEDLANQTYGEKNRK